MICSGTFTFIHCDGILAFGNSVFQFWETFLNDVFSDSFISVFSSSNFSWDEGFPSIGLKLFYLLFGIFCLLIFLTQFLENFSQIFQLRLLLSSSFILLCCWLPRVLSFFLNVSFQNLKGSFLFLLHNYVFSYLFIIIFPFYIVFILFYFFY